jgi:hypothetical protein
MLCEFLITFVILIVNAACSTLNERDDSSEIVGGHNVQERQVVSEVLTMVGVPMLANYLMAPEKLDLSPT